MKLSLQSQLSLIDILKPPTGYELEYCIGTTYSLNLECLVQLGLSSRRMSLKDDEAINPQKAFDVLSDIGSKFIIFCQACSIKELPALDKEMLNKDYRRFIGIMDSAIKVVYPSKAGLTFHPKVTLVKFKPEDKSQVSIFKLIVASRNLTMDLNWDIAASLSGIGTRATGKNADLVKFFKLIYSETESSFSSEQKTVFSGMLKELSCILFDGPFGNLPWNFDYQFSANDKFQFDIGDYNKLVVVSPFLTKSIIKDLGTHLEEFYLVTSERGRFEIKGLEKNKRSRYFEFRCDGMGLHSKIYIGQHKSGNCELILGSANCTASGLHRGSVEAVLKMDVPNSFYESFVENFIFEGDRKTISSVLDEFSPDLDDIEFDTSNLSEEVQGLIQLGRFYIAYKNSTMQLRYESKVKIPQKYSIKVRLFGSTQSYKLNLLFGAGVKIKMPLSEATRLLCIDIFYQGKKLDSFMTVAEGTLPISIRSKAIAKSTIRNWDEFLTFLNSVLGVNVRTKRSVEGAGGKKSKKREKRFAPEAQILEELLLRLEIDDNAYERIDSAFSAILSSNNDPHYESFIRLWRSITEALESQRKAA